MGSFFKLWFGTTVYKTVSSSWAFMKETIGHFWTFGKYSAQASGSMVELVNAFSNEDLSGVGSAITQITKIVGKTVGGGAEHIWKTLQLYAESMRDDNGMNAMHYLLLHVWKRRRQVRRHYNFRDATSLPVNIFRVVKKQAGYMSSAYNWLSGNVSNPDSTARNAALRIKYETNDRKLMKEHADLVNHLIRAYYSVPSDQAAGMSMNSITPQQMFDSIRRNADRKLVDRIDSEFKWDHKVYGKMRKL